MNAYTLATASIRARPLYSALCMSAVAAGITLLCVVFLLSGSLASGFSRNAKGIDMIVGTKGSPLQLVLSSVYHVDIPAGNITMEDYEDLKRNPHIRQAIPLALGDSYKGFRMVGTTPDYLNLYKAKFKKGHAFSAPFETVAGADTGLKIGEKIAVTHGFSANSDDVHGGQLYTITGVLKPTGTVLDKLLTTPLESVQQLHAGDNHNHDEAAVEVEHEEHGHEEGHHTKGHDEHSGHDEHVLNHTDHGIDTDMTQEITSVLLKVRSPIDLMNMPRQINESSSIMAAVPSYEIARFAKSLGIGRKIVVILGGGFVILSALMLWATLSSGLALRRYDLAVLRVLGATPRRLSNTVMAEALLISGIGAVFGVVFGHLIAYSAVLSIESFRGLVLPKTLLIPGKMDAGFILLGLGTGLCASFVPSLSAARTDIAGLLAKGRT